ncbi:nucleoside deaminase [Vagococcus sp. WN89Y]|uniref:nucleoside deaminase n=1 Tax=Vagococcus sp. WN89Y TaxID=3457258 RepID=UPI003FCE7CB7
MTDHDKYLQRAITLAAKNVEHGGRPFGAVVVRGDVIIAEAVNTLHTDGDPTAHAELNAIRDIAERFGNASLRECVVYASGQPCPMCLSAMYLTGVQAVYFANSNEDGEPYGLSTAAIYHQLQKPLAQQSLAIHHRPQAEGKPLYIQWSQHQS